MNFWMVILRLVHIFGGILWAGSGFFMVGFVSPASQLAGKEGQVFMRTLMGRTKYGAMMGISALLTMLSGLVMYYLLFGFKVPLKSSAGMALTVGGLAGIVAWVVGAAVHGRNGGRLQTIGAAVAAAGSRIHAGGCKKQGGLGRGPSGH